MKTLGIVANCKKPQAPDVVRRLVEKGTALGLAFVADEATAALVTGLEALAFGALTERVDAVIVVGGDGTLLRAARELGEHDTPLIGVNIGKLGFLTSVSEDECERALQCLVDESFEIAERRVVEGRVERAGEDVCCCRALNDIVITGPSYRMASLRLSIDGAFVTMYACDGIIIATPSGSTGHSLSAGGPIVVPGTAALVISVICPHTLSSRPLVVPEASEIVIELAESGADLQLAVDGQSVQALTTGDRVVIHNGAQRVRLVQMPDYGYYAVLRQKLRWSGSSL